MNLSAHDLWLLHHPVAGTLEGHLGAVTGLAASLDGALLVSAAMDGAARSWDLGSGTFDLLASVEDVPGGVTALALGPDGHTAALGCVAPGPAGGAVDGGAGGGGAGGVGTGAVTSPLSLGDLLPMLRSTSARSETEAPGGTDAPMAGGIPGERGSLRCRRAAPCSRMPRFRCMAGTCVCTPARPCVPCTVHRS